MGDTASSSARDEATPTIDTGHRVVVQAAQRLHGEILNAKGDLNAGAFRLGRALAEMQESRAYTALGHDTFEAYLASDAIALHRGTAYRFIRIYRLYGDVVHGRPWVQSMDLRKLDILGRLIDEDTHPDDVAALAAQAREMPREELRLAVRAEAERRGVLPAPGAQPVPAGPVRLVAPTPPTRLPAPASIAPPPDPELVGIVAAAFTDPEYRKVVLADEFRRVSDKLDDAVRRARDLIECVSPAEMAVALPEDELRRYRRRYDEGMSGLLAWYSQVLRPAKPGAIKRVK